MAAPIPSMSALRALRQSIQPQIQHTTQVRHATLLRRPKRPYTFTQLITLSDGSSFTVRTTSPQPVYKSAKDIRNSPLWNPSSQKLLNVEEDEAGKLAAFRAKFGRGWDADTDADKSGQQEDHLLDLISRQGKPSGPPTDATKAPPAKAPASTPAKPAAKK
ncbi:50s ribosomal protein [Stemphylium lycopersici]|uniref:50s ribosomal protein n=1 Tax=Stemphylium lycopersici TaxID=183478 RepID=A0A364N4T7_STELY|nr:50s ribosomal protein [Stemphylium lycopersici]RAR09574.1 50s ribosomal protein [Stemphylium lycopersici]RAR12114.1 50s ribosomal protein [Stemphylium lycopersici]